MESTLRVLHCAAGNLFGGVETLLCTLARERSLCPGMGPEFAYCFEGRLGDELRAAGVPTHALGSARFSRPWSVWHARRGFRRALNTQPCDVVVTHGCWPHLMFAPVARRAGVPVVYWLHDLIDGRHWSERRAARTPPDFTLANSRCTEANLPRVFPGGRHAVMSYPVVPPRIDQPAARAAVRDRMGVPEATAVIVQVSRMERWKGHALHLEALGQLRDRPGWVAWLVGGAQRPAEQGYLAELQAQARALGIADRVAFLGNRTDVPELLAAADIHCQPNTGPEPFGITFVEGLYAGLPVVSTRMGGAAEIVTDACGVLVPPADTAALAGALGHLIANPSARQLLGAAGPARARELCDPSAALARLEGLLRSAGIPNRVRIC